MMPSNRALATFCRRSVVTVSPSTAVWSHFSIKRFKLLVLVSRKW